MSDRIVWGERVPRVILPILEAERGRAFRAGEAEKSREFTRERDQRVAEENARRRREEERRLRKEEKRLRKKERRDRIRRIRDAEPVRTQRPSRTEGEVVRIPGEVYGIRDGRRVEPDFERARREREMLREEDARRSRIRQISGLTSQIENSHRREEELFDRTSHGALSMSDQDRLRKLKVQRRKDQDRIDRLRAIEERRIRRELQAGHEEGITREIVTREIGLDRKAQLDPTLREKERSDEIVRERGDIREEEAKERAITRAEARAVDSAIDLLRSIAGETLHVQVDNRTRLVKIDTINDAMAYLVVENERLKRPFNVMDERLQAELRRFFRPGTGKDDFVEEEMRQLVDDLTLEDVAEGRVEVRGWDRFGRATGFREVEEKVKILNPFGEKGEIPAEQLEEALLEGFKLDPGMQEVDLRTQYNRLRAAGVSAEEAMRRLGIE